MEFVSDPARETEKEKREIALGIVEAVRARGGQFLKKDPKTGTWCEIGVTSVSPALAHRYTDGCAVVSDMLGVRWYQGLIENMQEHGDSQAHTRPKENPQQKLAVSSGVPTQVEEIKLLKAGRPIRLAEERVCLLNGEVNEGSFHWESQSGKRNGWKSRKLLEDGEMELLAWCLFSQCQLPNALSEAGHCCIPISIKPYGRLGSSFVVNVSPHWSVHDVKVEIDHQRGVPPEQQQLCFKEKELKEGRTLLSCGITNNSVLELVLRLKGGAQPGAAAGERAHQNRDDGASLRGDFSSFVSHEISLRVASSNPREGSEQLGAVVSAGIRSWGGNNPAVISAASRIDGTIKDIGKHNSFGSSRSCGVYLIDSTLAAVNLEVTSLKKWPNTFELSATGDFFLVQGSNAEAEASLRRIMRRPQNIVFLVLKAWLNPGQQ